MYNRGLQTMMHMRSILYSMAIYTAMSLIPFRIFSTYSGIIRFSSFVDLQRVALANLVALVMAWIAHYGIYHLPEKEFVHFVTAQLIMIFMGATAMMWAMRVFVKILYDATSTSDFTRRALIYGTGDGGVALAKNIRSQRPTRFILRGFINHEESTNHHRMMGVKVYNTKEEIEAAINDNKISAVLISPLQKDRFRENEALQDLIINKGVKIYMTEQTIREEGDDAEKNKDGQGGEVVLKEVSVEDLLPREEINVDLKSVEEELKGKRVLITGSAGSIGSEIVRQVAKFGPASMMLIDQAETPEHDIRLMMQKKFSNIEAFTIVTSICHKDRMEKIFSDFRPDYVFHAAAYKHVPMMEDNPSEAVFNNVYGTKVIADLSVKYGVEKFVMISTDKAVNPTNVMGCSKRICEIYVQSLNQALKEKKVVPQPGMPKTQFVTTRFGNVLGSNGSVIPLFLEQIKNGGPVTVTDPNIIRFFMLIPEACKLVLEAGTKGNGGEIFVFDMGKPVRIADLAQRMIRLSGAKNVEIKFTGLRAGEKLYEEVLNEKENTKPTFHNKIRIAIVREYDYQEVCDAINQLIEIAKGYEDMVTVKKMKEIVPEFKSNNSKYEVLDNEGGVEKDFDLGTKSSNAN